eukprot:TRINITY_DN6775_c0_g1_i2.p1 TRINITY_DN6775_c0_g1~~TRINITY_DN6775_c0_g1_i2.p1  ORF type:complete len:266 (+),score=42.63 TRINITY_DN6775_c0_g1_i2:94-891(+)
MPMPQMREGDWNCPACGNHNYANRVACNKCAAPKQGNGGKGGYGGFIGYGQSKGAGKGREAAAPYNAGDWSCPGCGNHNYAKRMQCNRCAAPRPGAAPYGQMGNGFGQQQGGAAFGGKMMMMAVPVDMRPGDWLCRACGNHNYANRDNCNKCAMAKTVFIAKGGMRDGDWVCSGCQNHNYYRDKINCNKCGQPKQTSEAPLKKQVWQGSGGKGGGGFGGGFGGGQQQHSKPNMRPGDWVCPACNNHNYANRDMCNKCGAPKTFAG